ncbi:MAG: helix-hairpin-helix domain-containing protein [Pseudomonadales bacterium]
MTHPTFNDSVSATLRDTASVLEAQKANPFRVNAYRRAAETIDALDQDLREYIRQQGEEGLTNLPFIGRGLAATIVEIVQTGGHAVLERLRGSTRPERLFQTVPGIGPTLARRIYDSLHVDTLEGLEVAAHDGRLERVRGIGSRKADAIRAGLTSLLGRRRRPGAAASGPSVATLLEVDAEYQSKAERRRLPKIAPRRFNPERESWLPILHADREGWHFTALFSNTARAHELGRTNDWVVLYFYNGEHEEGQHTVVTETRGPLAGRRVVRGREAECARHYGARALRSAP